MTLCVSSQVDSSAQLAASAANLASSAAAASAAEAAAAAAAAGPSSSDVSSLTVNVAAAPMEQPPVPTSGGRRGRQTSAPSFKNEFIEEPAPAPRPASHKRGRGRKVSHKEAERQRLAAAAHQASFRGYLDVNEPKALLRSLVAA